MVSAGNGCEPGRGRPWMERVNGAGKGLCGSRPNVMIPREGRPCKYCQAPRCSPYCRLARLELPVAGLRRCWAGRRWDEEAGWQSTQVHGGAGDSIDMASRVMRPAALKWHVAQSHTSLPCACTLCMPAMPMVRATRPFARPSRSNQHRNMSKHAPSASRRLRAPYPLSSENSRTSPSA